MHGSIPTQLADGRGLADSEGSEVVAEFSDEAASAFKRNRGSGLVNALGLCEQLARESAGVRLGEPRPDSSASGSLR